MPSSRSRRAVRGAVAIAVPVLIHALARAPVRSALGCGAPPDGPSTADAELVLLSWNLRNFPGDHDRERIAARVHAARPHVLAVQEVLEGGALVELLPDRTVLLSARGGARHQTLGLAADARTTVLAPLVEHAALELGGRVRPAVSSYLKVGALDFHLVVVHLKAAPEGAPLRRLQWATLADLLARLPLGEPGLGDRDIVVLGDFNPTGDDGQSAAAERDALARVLAPLGLRALPIDGGCSAYWDGARHDGWLEPALLDLAFVGGFEGASWRATPLGACAAHACGAVRSTSAHPDPEIATTSDHCGVLVQLDTDRR